jgi:hypothetical protein
MPFSVDNRVGRLIEFRAFSPTNAEDLPEFVTLVRAAVLKPKTKVVICCDMRGNLVMHPDTAGKVVEVLRADNPLVERAGYLVDGAVFGLQIERIIREAKNENRRTFSSIPKLVGFLSAALTPAEIKRLQAFLEESPHRGAG